MSTTVSNWYVIDRVLHWWVPDAEGTSRGRDHKGRQANFKGYSVPIQNWQRYEGGIFRFVGSDGKRYDAAFSTHYKNPRYPEQYVADEAALIAKLS